MKHPTRYVSGRARKVSRGRRAISRRVSGAVKRMRNDPSIRKILIELLRHLAEFAARAVLLTAMNRCLQSGVSVRGPAQVLPLRPKSFPAF